MTTKALITALLLGGYLAALPVLMWGLGDLNHIPGGVWRHAARRPRRQWRAGMISSYVLGGWPAIVSVIMWWRSPERVELLDEWAHLSARKSRSRQRKLAAARVAREEGTVPTDAQSEVAPAAAGPEPVIVLSEHEDS